MPTKLARTRPPAFGRVGQARELLREKAVEILEQYLKVVKAAQDAGDYEVATKSLQWLIEHMPDDHGDRVIDVSVDKLQQIERPNAPTVQIGIQLGGLTHRPKELPAPTAVVTSEPISEPVVE